MKTELTLNVQRFVLLFSVTLSVVEGSLQFFGNRTKEILRFAQNDKKGKYA